MASEHRVGTRCNDRGLFRLVSHSADNWQGSALQMTIPGNSPGVFHLHQTPIKNWSEWKDSNLRPLGSRPSRLPLTLHSEKLVDTGQNRTDIYRVQAGHSPVKLQSHWLRARELNPFQQQAYEATPDS